MSSPSLAFTGIKTPAGRGTPKATKKSNTCEGNPFIRFWPNLAKHINDVLLGFPNPRDMVDHGIPTRGTRENPQMANFADQLCWVLTDFSAHHSLFQILFMPFFNTDKIFQSGIEEFGCKKSLG